ncbi:branched-chain amino acid ABC transporter permease [Streptomyces sp. NPDC051776]|uniref:branched-chain amino acid ABC transporter permease n=1 Tax=Streptomyces sp. NPDC051776 TaxID=3155414 RepID=UPI003436A86A
MTRNSAAQVRRVVASRTLARHLLLGALAALATCSCALAFAPYQNLQLATGAGYLCGVAGLTVLTGTSGQISLGHGALMAVGAYATALLLTDLHWPMPTALAGGTAAAALTGALVGTATARLQGPYLAGATLTLAVGLPALANYHPFRDTLGGENGLVVAPPVPPAGLASQIPLERWHAWIAVACATAVLILLANLKHSRTGRSWRAARDDEVSASLCGIRVARLRVLAFIVSAGCAGLGGSLLAIITSVAAPGAFALALSLSLLAGAVIGGLGSLTGAVCGAAVLVLLPQWASNVAEALHLSQGFYDNLPLALYGLALMLSIIVFPQGIHGAVARLTRTLRRRP